MPWDALNCLWDYVTRSKDLLEDFGEGMEGIGKRYIG